MKNIITNRTIATELLRRMKRIRHIEETIASKYSQWNIRCPVHLSTGQESVSAAVGLALKGDDFAVSTHRSHGHYLGKGGNLKKMIAELYGKVTGCSKGKGGSMHLIDTSVGFMGSTAIVGGTIPIGVGLGLSIKLHKTDQVSCVFLGDGAVEEGVFYESVNFAALKKLPVLFICENNFYSVYSSLSARQPAGRRIYQMVGGMGCLSVYGEGNDVLAVYAKVASAIDMIRKGRGPYFFEFDTYRWREHCGHNFDNDLGYRSEEEYEAWKDKDPILSLEYYLLNKSMLTKENIKIMESIIDKEVINAFEFAERSPFPGPKEAISDIYK